MFKQMEMKQQQKHVCLCRDKFPAQLEFAFLKRVTVLN